MTLHDAALYYDYAARNPTVRAMVAAYLGVKPSGGKSDDLNELLSMSGGTGAIR